MKPLFYLFFAAIGIVPGYQIYREVRPKLADKMKAEFAPPERTTNADFASLENAHRDFIDERLDRARDYLAQHSFIPGSSMAVHFYDEYLPKAEKHDESRVVLAQREEDLRILARRDEALRILAEREKSLRMLAHREEELRLAELREKSHHEPDGGLNTGNDKWIHEHKEPQYKEPEHREPEHKEPEHKEPERKEPDWFARTTNWTSPFQKSGSAWPPSDKFGTHPWSTPESPLTPPSFPDRPTAGPLRPATGSLGSTGGLSRPTTGSQGSTTGPLHPNAPTVSSHTVPPPPPRPRPVVPTVTTTTVTH